MVNGISILANDNQSEPRVEFPIPTLGAAAAPSGFSVIPPTLPFSHQVDDFFGFVGIKFTISQAIHAKLANSNVT